MGGMFCGTSGVGVGDITGNWDTARVGVWDIGVSLLL